MFGVQKFQFRGSGFSDVWGLGFIFGRSGFGHSGPLFWTFGVRGFSDVRDSGFIFGRSGFGHLGPLFWTFGVFGRSGFGVFQTFGVRGSILYV